MVSAKNGNIQPRIEHYACMVDLLGRYGLLEEAYNFIKSMPMEPDSGVWGALLGACTTHQNTELGQHVADILSNLAPETGSYRVLLSNIYAASGLWGDVAMVRRKMRRKSVKKVAGYSSVESNGEICVFHGGDRSHPLTSKQLLSANGDLFMPETLHDCLRVLFHPKICPSSFNSLSYTFQMLLSIPLEVNRHSHEAMTTEKL
ncbi:hypothetical protein IFM89_014924 [Coptis chinensis]|uniref:Pentatricopeptide repeat-containing protein n=1 Tax=Coptis chinensis TaxID=261450 RepID=A0A835LI04_9MAGN|nr:hypothetical protein IFM89_014924 [Coptis chinensis]